ncbi:MAG: hypothetical protein ACE5HO_17875 [bacterium]
MKAYFHNLPIRIKFVVPMVAALAGMLVSVLIYLPAYHMLANCRVKRTTPVFVGLRNRAPIGPLFKTRSSETGEISRG